jgi:hypothetical protein
MFSNTSMMGMDTGYPDVCLTPSPAPVPIPYPNIAMGPMGIMPVVNCLLSVGPAHNVGTVIPLTNGDNPGVALGVASGLVMGPARHVVPCIGTIIGGLPMTKLTTVAIQNSTNCPGVRVVPSQVRVLSLT